MQNLSYAAGVPTAQSHPGTGEDWTGCDKMVRRATTRAENRTLKVFIEAIFVICQNMEVRHIDNINYIAFFSIEGYNTTEIIRFDFFHGVCWKTLTNSIWALSNYQCHKTLQEWTVYYLWYNFLRGWVLLKIFPIWMLWWSQKLENVFCLKSTRWNDVWNWLRRTMSMAQENPGNYVHLNYRFWYAYILHSPCRSST